MKKFLLSSSVVILFALYVYKTFGTQVPTPEPQTAPDATSNVTQGISTNTAVATTNTVDTDDDENENEDEDDAKTTPASTQTNTTQVTTTTTTPAPTPKPTTTPIAIVPATTQSIYKDGTFTGPVVDAFYGNIQVQVKIAAGKITDVIFLQYPNDQENSIKVNTRAMPLLKSEIIAAQSANINGASGASFSSPATKKSVSGALALAKK